jgi:hypothetical protein
MSHRKGRGKRRDPRGDSSGPTLASVAGAWSMLLSIVVLRWLSRSL